MYKNKRKKEKTNDEKKDKFIHLYYFTIINIYAIPF